MPNTDPRVLAVLTLRDEGAFLIDLWDTGS